MPKLQAPTPIRKQEIVTMEGGNILDHVERCLDAFNSLVKAVADSPVPVSRSGKDASVVNSLRDEQTRFKIWSRNIAAHKTGMSSLEYRLQDASQVKNQVIRLLQDLEALLKDCSAIVSGEKIPWDQMPNEEPLSGSDEQEEFSLDSEDEEGTEIEQISGHITEAVNCLLRLSTTIRNLAPHDRFMKSRETDTSAFDLRPDTYLPPDCVTPEREFARRHEWTEHMRQSHFHTYKCPYGCDSVLSSVDECKDHLEKRHLSGSGAHAELESMIKLAAQPLDSCVGIPCPLCGETVYSISQYQSHVGRHQEQLALFALAPSDAGEPAGEDEAKSDPEPASVEVSSVDSNNQTLEPADATEDLLEDDVWPDSLRETYRPEPPGRGSPRPGNSERNDRTLDNMQRLLRFLRKPSPSRTTAEDSFQQDTGLVTGAQGLSNEAIISPHLPYPSSIERMGHYEDPKYVGKGESGKVEGEDKADPRANVTIPVTTEVMLVDPQATDSSRVYVDQSETVLPDTAREERYTGDIKIESTARRAGGSRRQIVYPLSRSSTPEDREPGQGSDLAEAKEITSEELLMQDSIDSNRPPEFSRLAPDSHGQPITLDAKWTKVKRSLVSLAVLDRRGMRYKAQPDYVLILGELSREEIADLAS